MNLGFEKIKVYFEEGENPLKYGKITVEPLERGFATTIGNALRRIMISSLPGTAVIGVKIPGVVHKFRSIPGASTDATTLSLNLKKLRFKDTEFDDKGYSVIRLEANKFGTYTGADLDLPSNIEVQNPEQEIIKLTGDQPFELEIYVKSGRGYIKGDSHIEFEKSPDVIGIDALFAPIESLKYYEENIRVGEKTDYEKLVLEIETDGTIHPKDATSIASKIVRTHFDFFDEMSNIVEKTEIYKEQEEEENRILDMGIDRLDLSVRAFNCLKREGFTDVRKIIDLTEAQLYAVHQLGKKSVEEIIDKIHELGLELKKE